jgi:hypothetical protein
MMWLRIVPSKTISWQSDNCLQNMAEANWMHRKDYRNSLPGKRPGRGMTRSEDNREQEVVLTMGK